MVIEPSAFSTVCTSAMVFSSAVTFTPLPVLVTLMVTLVSVILYKPSLTSTAPSITSMVQLVFFSMVMKLPTVQPPAGSPFTVTQLSSSTMLTNAFSGSTIVFLLLIFTLRSISGMVRVLLRRLMTSPMS